MTIYSILCLFICLAAAYFIVAPFFGSDTSSATVLAGSSILQDQRERCVQVLRDLELDHATGKVSAEEYQRMRASVGQELLSIVDQLKLNLQN